MAGDEVVGALREQLATLLLDEEWLQEAMSRCRMDVHVVVERACRGIGGGRGEDVDALPVAREAPEKLIEGAVDTACY